jgi:hypothetical protein
MRSELPRGRGLPSGPHEVDHAIIHLRANGVSLAGIGAVLHLYHGWSLTEDQVRWRARQLKAHKGVNPSRRRRTVAS